jgi:hypothetical protein
MNMRIHARKKDPNPIVSYDDWICVAEILDERIEKLMETLDGTVFSESQTIDAKGYAQIRHDALSLSEIALKIIEAADEALASSVGP